MQRLQGLLLGVFDRNGVPVRPHRGGTDCRGIIGIVLPAQQIGQVLQQASDLIDERSTLRDQSLPYAVQASIFCCSTVFTATKRIVGRCAASQIAAASFPSFLFVFTNGLTNLGLINAPYVPVS
jgi:hypothetical protein